MQRISCTAPGDGLVGGWSIETGGWIVPCSGFPLLMITKRAILSAMFAISGRMAFQRAGWRDPLVDPGAEAGVVKRVHGVPLVPGVRGVVTS